MYEYEDVVDLAYKGLKPAMYRTFSNNPNDNFLSLTH